LIQIPMPWHNGPQMSTENLPDTDQPAAQTLHRSIGRRIATLRSRRDWTQRDLARQADILPSRLSKLERGLRAPKLDELMRLTEALEVSLDELVLGEPPRTRVLQLLRALEALGTPEELAGIRRLLELLLAGYRTAVSGPVRPERAPQ
jgi:transcriptional regulator with XRE-family HTH domain